MENVDEETEAKLAQEMKESREKLQEEADDIVVIDKDESEATIRRELEQHHHHPQTDRKAFLSEQRDILRLHPAHAPAVSGTSSVHAPLIPINVPARRPPHRPLSRTQSSPLVTFNFPRPSNAPEQQEPLPLRFTTGIAYDTMMLKHQCTCGNNQNHPEHAGRIQSIWARLQEAGLAARCEKVKARKASREELQSCHSEVYTLIYGTNPLHRQKLDPQILETLPTRFCMLPCGGIGVDSDTVWNELHTSYAARMATGCAIETSMKVAAGELKNGMAIVRPPGHHAEHQQPMGFCFFNSVAVAAKQLREKLNLRRILIVDWDVHHGNGTQQVFYNDPSVMYISLHRHDDGNFFPGTGALDECGEKEGLGYTVNVAFTGSLDPPMRDADYMMAFRTVVMPIAREFNPELVLVSAGFDAAKGHPAPLGGYELSGACFGHMTKQLMTLAGGKVVLVLEGGYDLPAICDASEICVKALLGDEVRPLSEEETNRKPCEAAIKTVQAAISYQARYWPVVTKYADSITMSMMEAQRREQREREENDTVSALASLSMVTARRSGGLSSMSSTESEPMEES
ncbi:histone deacetylase 4-like [Lingula anatina]|nr:histone deacetylase 4-like [Lingula anatina]|eukprot:XP_013391785.2 histone deacetylase 4-like [Lingula anatina]